MALNENLFIMQNTQSYINISCVAYRLARHVITDKLISFHLSESTVWKHRCGCCSWCDRSTWTQSRSTKQPLDFLQSTSRRRWTLIDERERRSSVWRVPGLYLFTYLLIAVTAAAAAVLLSGWLVLLSHLSAGPSPTVYRPIRRGLADGCWITSLLVRLKYLTYMQLPTIIIR